jgi:hypothetical protein
MGEVPVVQALGHYSPPRTIGVVTQILALPVTKFRAIAPRVPVTTREDPRSCEGLLPGGVGDDGQVVWASAPVVAGAGVSAVCADDTASLSFAASALMVLAADSTASGSTPVGVCAFRWRKLLDNGTYCTIKEIAAKAPGRIYEATIVDIPRGVGQGQVAVSGVLARVGSIGGVKAYPAQISIPNDIDRGQLRLGMPGAATVFAGNAGVIGTLMSILVWISSYTAYL